MLSKRLKEQASEKAFNYFQSGFHCAESISQAIVGLHGGDVDGSEVQRFAAGFMGGIGGTHQDTCGALTAEFRRRFVAEFGSSNCQVLLDRVNEREDDFDCKKLTAVAAGLLSEVLAERGL
jgi:hypothetical protein